MSGMDSARFLPLRIVASGICCAVGYNAEAASCALRAAMDNFAESEFAANDGSVLRVARLYNQSEWGASRLAMWARYAVNECFEQLPPEERERTPILMVTAAPDRPQSGRQIQLDAAKALSLELEHPLAPHSQLLPGGRAAMAQALRHAETLLNTKKAQKVLIVGMDSYLDAATIMHFLAEERLLVPDNSDGFIPGEAAAAVVVELAAAQVKGTHVCGVGQGQEPGRPDGSIPSRAQGLSAAIREAMQQARINGNDLAFRVSDQNGEAFFAREAANAITRISEEAGTIPQVLTTADCTGEIGAATGPLMLAWLHRWLGRADAPGAIGMLHLANDDGARTAIVVRHFQ